MKTSLITQCLITCLISLQVHAKSVSQNSSEDTYADLRFPTMKYAHSLGPNCHGTSLGVTGLSGGLITDWHWALDLILKSPFCVPVKKADIRYGDLGAVRVLGDPSLGSNLAHSMIFLSSNHVFQKGAYLEDSPFEKIKLSAICHKYNIEGLCPRASAERPHQYSLEVYRCQRVDYSPLEQGLELDRQLRQVEELMEQLALSGSPVSAQEHAIVMENLKSISEIGLQNHFKVPQTDSSRRFFQNLLWRRLMNIKTQLHEVLRYPFSKEDVFQALDKALQSINPL